jgi:hypothetical protein
VKKKRVPSIGGEGGIYSNHKVLKSEDKINLNSSTSNINPYATSQIFMLHKILSSSFWKLQAD